MNNITCFKHKSKDFFLIDVNVRARETNRSSAAAHSSIPASAAYRSRTTSPARPADAARSAASRSASALCTPATPANRHVINRLDQSAPSLTLSFSLHLPRSLAPSVTQSIPSLTPSPPLSRTQRTRARHPHTRRRRRRRRHGSGGDREDDGDDGSTVANCCNPKRAFSSSSSNRH
jgi:hypothetical protein